ncbi:MAG: TldD/PmbA family protein, partial [Candidatus Cloacimonetes bacterium]|nr:TldD/PmbA family protein [Candidatus Cloacimonadota bacterium]
MNNREILEFTLNKLMQKGAQKAELSLQVSEKEELETASGKLNLFRTTQEKNLNLTALIDDKKGSVQINKLAKDEILEAVDQVIELARSSQADPANDIAPLQTPEQFTRGPEKPDHDLMYDRLNDFLIFTRERFPKIILEQVILDFNISYNNYLNSNGVAFSSRESGYNFFPMFTAKDGEKTSSFNYTAVSSKNLDRELANWGVTADLLAQSSEQVETSALEKKFVGDIIVTPDCLGEFIGYLTAYLREYSLISGNSIYLNKLGEKIAHEQLSLHSKPLSDELDEGYFFTQDGFKVNDSTI